MKRHSCLMGAAILLVPALMILPAAEPAPRAGNENEASLAALPTAPKTALRSAPERQGRQHPAEEVTSANSVIAKRDPFEVPPPPKADGGAGDTSRPLPPGVRGLVIAQLRLEGIVRDDETGSMIAVVTNRSNLAYFLHLHEEVYNGAVTRITPDAIYFQQKTRDSGGPVDAQEVVLRLGSERQEAR